MNINICYTLPDPKTKSNEKTAKNPSSEGSTVISSK
jgi:hypothetical protein